MPEPDHTMTPAAPRGASVASDTSLVLATPSPVSTDLTALGTKAVSARHRPPLSEERSAKPARATRGAKGRGAAKSGSGASPRARKGGSEPPSLLRQLTRIEHDG